MKVYIGFLLLSRFLACAVGLETSCELFEFHNVARKRACFVAKNILDLSKFFIKITCLGLHRHILFIIIHLNIQTHEHGLPEFDQL
jgi:hypothetical protein